MPIKDLLIFLVLIVLVAILGEKLLRKKFNIEKRGWFYPSVNRLHKRSETIILSIWNFVIYLITFVGLRVLH